MTKKYIILFKDSRMPEEWRPGLFTHDSQHEALGEALMELDAVQREADGVARYKLLPPERVGRRGWRLVAEPIHAGGYPQPFREEALVIPIEISEVEEKKDAEEADRPGDH